MKAVISSERFIIKSLDPEVDDFASYLSWMRDKNANLFIQGIDENFLYQDLVTYVSRKNHSEAAILFGIFVKPDSIHIGNVKLELFIPRKSAAIGILIGEEGWRGKGVGFEVITRVLEYCFIDLELESVELGVNKKNLRAINLYTRLGFTENAQESDSQESVGMRISKLPV